jgi:hypothetical protein
LLLFDVVSRETRLALRKGRRSTIDSQSIAVPTGLSGEKLPAALDLTEMNFLSEPENQVRNAQSYRYFGADQK